MNQKRFRSVNWEEGEKHILRTVIKDHSTILENKSMDTNTNKAKSKAWNEVLKKFNELNFRARSLSQLQIQWKTMKINARKTAHHKNEEVIISDLINQVESVTNSSTTYDSDGYLSTQQSVEPTVEIMELSKQFPEHNPYEVPNSTAEQVLSQNSSSSAQKLGPTKKRECVYTREIITHSKNLKDTEHKRHLEREDEAHARRMEINAIHLKKAKIELKCAEIELEILELKKAKEKLLLEKELKK